MQSAECGMDGGRIGVAEMPVAGNRKSVISIGFPEVLKLTPRVQLC